VARRYHTTEFDDVKSILRKGFNPSAKRSERGYQYATLGSRADVKIYAAGLNGKAKQPVLRLDIPMKRRGGYLTPPIDFGGFRKGYGVVKRIPAKHIKLIRRGSR
jgi:hypothetical protein